jgi:sugar phosphate isomerase/epimerase
MIKCGNWPVGVCSWSLQRDVPGVAEAMKELSITHVHLDVGPACEGNPDAYLGVIRREGWTISSTMIGFPQEDYTTLETIKKTGGIVPDGCWEDNKARFIKAIRATAALKVRYLSSHFGFLDTSRPEYARTLHDRVRLLADAAAEHQVVILMETGQEKAEELREFLEAIDHPALGVNFDPANMILYNMGNPLEGVKILRPWVKHIHIKDAIRTQQPGTWGQEVVWGTGQVDADAFLKTLKELDYQGVLSIEREAGEDRLGDIQKAVQKLATFSA